MLCRVGATLAACLPASPHLRALSCGALNTARRRPPGSSPGPTFASVALGASQVANLWAVARAFPRLEHLTAAVFLPDVAVCGALPAVPHLGALDTLRSLHLSAAPTAARAAALPLSPLTALSALRLRYGNPDLDIDGPFTPQRAAAIATLPALRDVSLTLVNHGFEQAAADALAAAPRLTALELLRDIASTPMHYFDWVRGAGFLAGLSGLRRLRLNDARYIAGGGPRDAAAPGSFAPLATLTALDTLALSGAPPALHACSACSACTFPVDAPARHAADALCKAPSGGERHDEVQGRTWAGRTTVFCRTSCHSLACSSRTAPARCPSRGSRACRACAASTSRATASRPPTR